LYFFNLNIHPLLERSFYREHFMHVNHEYALNIQEYVVFAINELDPQSKLYLFEFENRLGLFLLYSFCLKIKNYFS